MPATGRRLRPFAVCAALAVLVVTQSVFARAIDTADDGWISWKVEAVINAPNWCCVLWRSGTARPVACDLDGKDLGFSTRHGSSPTEMRIYALIASGKLQSVRALEPRCPVSARGDIADLGLLSADISLAWLRRYAEPHTTISSDVLAAISVHAGAGAREALLDIARGNRDVASRMDAIFWLGQVRIREVVDEIRELALSDRDDDIREQAVFALAQLPDEEAGRVLIGIIENRDLAIETRRNALFWLVESGSDTAMDYLTRLFASR